MTLASTTNKVSYSGNGSTTAFAVTFTFWAAADLRVILRSAAGVETVWVITTDYTVTGGSGSTGTVTAVVAPASGTTLTIKSNLGLTQDTDLPAGGDFPSDSVEQQLDKIVRMGQQKDEELDRAPKFAETSTASDITFPDPSADKIVGWNAAGDDLENKTANTSAYVTLPGSSTDNAVVRFDGTGGASFQNSGVTIGDTDVATFPKQVIFTKGADIASASPLVLGTDGNYFDVTGTTGFSAITVAAGTLFMLQFDGALTLTHGASLDLPGEANITTAAGDRLIGFAEAANTVQVLSYSKADGTAVVAGAAGFTQGTPQATTSGSAVTFGSIPAGTDMIVMSFRGVSTNGTGSIRVQIGDAGGLEAASYVSMGDNVGTLFLATTGFAVANSLTAAQTYSGQIILVLEDASDFTWTAMSKFYSDDGATAGWTQTGYKALSAELTQIALVTADTFDAGEINIAYQ